MVDAQRESKSESQQALIKLQEWWLEQAEQEAAAVIPKAIEYGSGDLDLIGATTADLLGLKTTTPAERIEIAIAWYCLGKIGRAISAIKGGRAPSTDTWRDISTYATMCLYAREHGRWP